MVPGDRNRGNGHKLKQRRCHLNTAHSAGDQALARIAWEAEGSHLADSQKPSRQSSGKLAAGGQASSPKRINEDFCHWK